MNRYHIALITQLYIYTLPAAHLPSPTSPYINISTYSLSIKIFITIVFILKLINLTLQFNNDVFYLLIYKLPDDGPCDPNM
jgi:hypothetical protein